MNIVVCVKQVPETSAKKEITADFRLNRPELEAVINPFDEYAIEESLRLKEQHGGEVTVLTMGPESAEDTIRKALAMGADTGVLVTDPALEGTDAWGTAYVLGQALQRLRYDIVMTGMESTEARTGLVPAALAQQVALPALTYAQAVSLQDGKVRINRQIPGGYQEVEADLPVLISVVKGVNEPRYPSLKGIMAARRKEVRRFSLADLQIEPPSVGATGAREQVVAATPRAERTAGEKISGTPEEIAIRIADFLADQKFI
ncbi:MAG TPA: electron transfer flavoprotein subunit beta/FixA family protein [Chloroflexota bacterium]|nr:electron transfer flavoprotein subunit beta/FixA family protein [Chloroflexota bacterium]